MIEDERLKIKIMELKIFFIVFSLLLIIVCLAGLATDHMMMVVSKDPLATNVEFGDQATLLTLALWKPHSLL